MAMLVIPMAVIGGPVDLGVSLPDRSKDVALVASGLGPSEEPVDDAAPAEEEQVVWDEPAPEEAPDSSSGPSTSATRKPAAAAFATASASGGERTPKATTTTTDAPRKPSTTAAPRTTSPPTTSPPPTKAPPPPRNTEEGEASWYQHIDGTCAHKTIKFDTIVTVTNLQNGKSTTCRVADRGPFGPGRIIDLDKEVFEQLAPASQGVFPARITWS